MWYRQAADTGQIQRDWFRDLPFYRRMKVLCWRIQTSRLSYYFLFRRIGVAYRRLASTPTSPLLRCQFPALRLVDHTCFPFTPVHTKNLDSKKRTQHGPSTSAKSLRPQTHFIDPMSPSNLYEQPHTHSPALSMVTVNQVSPLLCLSILSLATTTAKTMSSAH